MGKIKVHAGDFTEGDLGFLNVMTLKSKAHPWMGESITLDKLESVELASEDSVKRIGGTVGWGVAGAVVLGPVGLLAGLLLGGKGKDVTFVAKFKDGRKMLATTDSKTYTKLQSAVFS